jgi:curved DNA-binding protein CbpA
MYLMNDPYSVLGVSAGASDDEVKKAYHELVRKYHPDNYHDNPLADLASEKMKEINEAYDEVTKQRAGGGGHGAGAYAYSGYAGSAGSARFAGIRQAINEGELGAAERRLMAIADRNAEWHFLMGSLYYRKGWLDDALTYYKTAAAMEPNNAEYRQALDYMNRGGQAYRPYGYEAPAANAGCDACDICTALMCADMCCRCG